MAEFAYGINVQGAQIAYQFDLNKADSLRIIQIYFAPMQNNVSNIPFHLVVWEDNNGIPGNIVLKSDLVYPVYHDRIKFHNYYLKCVLFRTQKPWFHPFYFWVVSLSTNLNLSLIFFFFFF